MQTKPQKWVVHRQRKKKPEKVHNSFNATHADTWSIWSFHLSSSAFPGTSGFFPRVRTVPFRFVPLNSTWRHKPPPPPRESTLLMKENWVIYLCCSHIPLIVFVWWKFFPPPPLRKNQKEMWKKNLYTFITRVLYRRKVKKRWGFPRHSNASWKSEREGKKPLESSHDTQFSFRLRLFIHHRLKGSLI